MLFYRYQSVSLASLAMLKNGEIFFASPQELNDVHECKPRFIFNGNKEIWLRFIDLVLIDLCCYNTNHIPPEVTGKIIELCDEVYEEFFSNTTKRSFEYLEVIKILQSAIPTVIKKHFNTIESEFFKEGLNNYLENEFKSQLHQDRYIASFSLSIINPMMWGNYGNSERGFAVIYGSDDECINFVSDYPKPNEKIQLNLEKVTYSSNPVKVNAFNRLRYKFRYTEDEERDWVDPSINWGKFHQMEENKVGLTKSSSWKYEKEIRLLHPTNEIISSSFRCLKISNNHIKGIVFGSKMSQSDKEKVSSAYHYLKLSTGDNGSCYFFEATEISGRYDIAIKAVGFYKEAYPSEGDNIASINEASDHQQGEISNIEKEINLTP